MVKFKWMFVLPVYWFELACLVVAVVGPDGIRGEKRKSAGGEKRQRNCEQELSICDRPASPIY